MVNPYILIRVAWFQWLPRAFWDTIFDLTRKNTQLISG